MLFLWGQIFSNSENIYRYLGGVLAIPFLGVLVGIVLPMMVAKKIDSVYEKNNFTKILTPLWLVIFSLIILIYPLLERSIFIQNLTEFMFDFSAQLVKFIMGFLPLGLFYELFIGSILGKEEDIKFLK